MSQVIASDLQSKTPIGDLDSSIETVGSRTELGDFVAYTVASPAALDTLCDQWSELSENSSSPNSFYEPAFFQAATKHEGESREWRIVVVADEKNQRLAGFFPFMVQRKFGVFRVLSLWNSKLVYLTTPLIRVRCEEEVLNCMFAHVISMRPHIDALEFPLALAQDRVHQELHSLFRKKLLTTFQFNHYARAAVEVGVGYETYIKSAIGGHHLRGYRRQLRKLEERGQVELRVGTDPGSATCWSGWFLDLEAAGWKGQEGTAMKQHPEQAAFFQDLVAGGMQQGRLEMIGLFLNGEPIALGCTLLSGTGGFTYKIAFDERYKKYSPGILLHLSITERLLNNGQLNWLDSCASPDHPMINRLWQERRSIEHLLVSTGSSFSNLALGALPLLRSLKRVFRKSKR